MARRGPHEGTITHRKDGRWEARLTLPDGRRKSYYGNSRTEVQSKLQAGRESLRQGLPIPTDQLRLGAYLADWLHATRSTIRISTWTRYEQLLRVHALPALGHIPLVKLTPSHFQRLYADLLDRGSAAATVRQLHAVLRRALGQAVRWGILPRNVVALASGPRVPHREMRVLTPEQARALLDASRGERFEALYHLALTTGMRIGELLGLQWKDVDLDKGVLHVRQTLLRNRHNGLRLREPKTARSRRQIALTPSVVAILRAHRSRQTEERLRLGRVWQDHGMVFCTEIGTYIEAGNLLRRSFQPLLARTGILRIRFHDLRHSAATLLLRRGVNVKIVSEMLGHSTIALTLDTYSHVLPDMQDQAVQVMEDELGR